MTADSGQLLVHAGQDSLLHIGTRDQDSAAIQPTEVAERGRARILSSIVAEISD